MFPFPKRGAHFQRGKRPYYLQWWKDVLTGSQSEKTGKKSVKSANDAILKLGRLALKGLQQKHVKQTFTKAREYIVFLLWTAPHSPPLPVPDVRGVQETCAR